MRTIAKLAMWLNEEFAILPNGLGSPTSNTYLAGYRWLNHEFKLQQLYDERPLIKI